MILFLATLVLNVVILVNTVSTRDGGLGCKSPSRFYSGVKENATRRFFYFMCDGNCLQAFRECPLCIQEKAGM